MRNISKAIVRKPGANFGEGQTTAGLGQPDMEKVRQQHMKYVWTLFSFNIEVDLLMEDPAYPDGCFVEDTAILTDHGAVICRPGHPSRQGEEKEISELLGQHFDLFSIAASGTVDGGDVLRIGNHFLIGQSARTNAAGAGQLADILKHQGYRVDILPVADGLHLKSGLSQVGEESLLATEDFAGHAALQEYELIRVSPEENYAANCLYINGKVVLSDGFPRLTEALQQRKIELTLLDMSEFRKMDGSLTCLSLLW